MNATKSYDIVIEPEIADLFRTMADAQHAGILERLVRAAEDASAPRRRRVGIEHIPGVHRGLHRAPVGAQWIKYRVDHARQTVSLFEVSDRAAQKAVTGA